MTRTKRKKKVAARPQKKIVRGAAREWWMQSPADEIAVKHGCYFELAAAERVREFFRRFLRHSKGQFAGQPFELMPWQWERLIGPLFGWKRADGTRRFRKAYVEIPKKNGKSTLCSGIALYMLVADGEPGAEVFAAAADKEQASIVHNEASNMVQQSSELSRVLEVVRSTKRIVFPKKQSWFKALSADVPTKEGLNAHGIIFDELHAQRTRDMWDTLEHSAAARRQPLQIAITTAGYDRHSICFEQHEYAQRVIDGVIEDDAFFPLIYSAPEDADWTKEKVWLACNPSIGVTISIDKFREACQVAQDSPAKENGFRRYLLNQWTEQDVRWLQLAKWDACAERFEVEKLAGKSCFAGLDLASSTDIAALALLFPDEDVEGLAATGEGQPRRYKLLVKFWVPAEGARKRSRLDRVPYEQWITEGLITATSGDVIDYGVIRREIGVLGKLYDIKEIAFDRWGAPQLSTDLQGDGFTMVSFGQGFGSMASPTKELEKLVLGGSLLHGGNPVLRWMAGNIVVETDAAGNYKPNKKKSRERIDGLVATIMALGRAMATPVTRSVYESRGVITL